ncbi:MAG: hypothetical protein ACI8ZM_005530 [Crocinitomix sp.]|jgi:hypothetical protein
MKKTIVSAFTLALFSLGSFAQGYSEIQKVTALDRESEDRMGWAVDMDGDYAIVGAYGDDFGAVNPNMGSAHMYQRNDEGIWEFTQKIFNDDQDDYDRFAWAVAINDNLAVIGAYGEDEDENDENNLSKAGSAYIFERDVDGTWNEVQKIVASDRAEGVEFGFSVAIDGDLIVIGSHYNNTDAVGGGYSLHAGAAYIFEQNVDGEWVELQKLVASDRWGNPGFDYEEEDWNWRYGESVAVENDYVVVGSPFASKGYMYERTGDTWSEVEQLTYPGIAWLDRAGIVSISGTTVLLGAQTWDYSEEFGDDALMNAGGAAIFDRVGDGDWTFTQMIVGGDRSAGDHFGISVSIDGDLIASGAHQDNHDEDTDGDMENAGSAYVFKRIDGVWEQIEKVDNSDRAIGDQLGIAVAASVNTVLIGAFQQDFAAGGGDYQEDAGAGYFYIDTDDEDCPTVYSSQSPSICDGEEFIVGPSTYTESGTYSDVLISVDGCDSVVTTYLNVVTDDPYEYEATICPGQSVIVGESEYTEEGTYTDIFESVGGCDSIVETTIVLSDDVIENEIVEEDGFGLFTTAFGMETYQWITCDPFEIIPGATGPFYMPTEDGEYGVIVMSEGGCIDTSDCVTIGDGGGGPGDELVVPVDGSAEVQTACEGTFFDSGGSEDGYAENEDGQLTISPTGAATVELTIISFDVQTGVGCVNDRVIFYDGPSTSDPVIGTYCNSVPPPATLSSTGPSITIAFESDFTFSLEGFEIDWLCNPSTDGIEEENINEFSIYPNPNNGMFTIKAENLSNTAQVEIINELGQVVYLGALLSATNQIDLQNIANGIYIAKITNKGEIAYERFVVN